MKLKDIKYSKWDIIINSANILSDSIRGNRDLTPVVIQSISEFFSQPSPQCTQEVDLLSEFKEKNFNRLIEISINSIEDCFNQAKLNRDLFEFLYNYRDLDTTTLLNKCTSLANALSFQKLNPGAPTQEMILHKDIDGLLLFEEMKKLSLLSGLNAFTKPLDFLSYISCDAIAPSFPNYYTALTIYLTLPDSIASGEQTFQYWR